MRKKDSIITIIANLPVTNLSSIKKLCSIDASIITDLGLHLDSPEEGSLYIFTKSPLNNDKHIEINFSYKLRSNDTLW